MPPRTESSANKSDAVVIANAAAATTTQVVLSVVIDSKLFQEAHITPDIMMSIANSLTHLLLNYARTELETSPLNMRTEFSIMLKQMFGQKLTEEEIEYDKQELHDIDVAGEILNVLSYSASFFLGQSFLNATRNAISQGMYQHLPAITGYFASLFIGPTLLYRVMDYVLGRSNLSPVQQRILRPWCEAIGNLVLNLKPRVHVTADGRVEYKFPSLQVNIESFSADHVVTRRGDHVKIVNNRDGSTAHFQLTGEAREKFDMQKVRFDLRLDHGNGFLEVDGIRIESQRLLADKPYQESSRAETSFIESSKQLVLNSMPVALMLVPGSVTVRAVVGVMLLSKFVAAQEPVQGISPAEQKRLNNLLLDAIDKKDTKAALFALQQGADPEKTLTTNGVPAMGFAAHKGLTEVVRALIGKVQLNVADDMRHSPLMHALEMDHLDCAEILLQGGADPNFHPEGVDSPLIGVTHDERKVPHALLLLQYNVDPNAVDKTGKGALRRSVKFPELVAALIEKGAIVNVVQNGETPLVAAAYEGVYKSVKILLDKGADPNFGAPKPGSSNAFGNTLSVEGSGSVVRHGPLGFALGREYEDIAILLIEHGADCSPQALDGTNVLQWAKEHNLMKLYNFMQIRSNVFLSLQQWLVNSFNKWKKPIAMVATTVGVSFGLAGIINGTKRRYDEYMDSMRDRSERCEKAIKQFVKKFSLDEELVQQQGKYVYVLRLGEDRQLAIDCKIGNDPYQGVKAVRMLARDLFSILVAKLSKIEIVDSITDENDHLEIRIKFKSQINDDQVQALPEQLNKVREEIIREQVPSSAEWHAVQQREAEAAEKQRRQREIDSKRNRFCELQKAYDGFCGGLKTIEQRIKELKSLLAELEGQIDGVTSARPRRPNLPDALAQLRNTKEDNDLRNSLQFCQLTAARAYDGLSAKVTLLEQSSSDNGGATAGKIVDTIKAELLTKISELEDNQKRLTERQQNSIVCKWLAAHNSYTDIEFSAVDLAEFETLRVDAKKMEEGVDLAAIKIRIQSVSDDFKKTFSKYREAMDAYNRQCDGLTALLDGRRQQAEAAAEATRAQAEQKQREKEQREADLARRREERRLAVEEQQRQRDAKTKPKNGSNGSQKGAQPAGSASGTSGIRLDEIVPFLKPNLAEINITATTIFGILQRYRAESSTSSQQLQLRYQYALLGNLLRLFEVMKDWHFTGINTNDIRNILMHAWNRLSFQQLYDLALQLNDLLNSIHLVKASVDKASLYAEDTPEFLREAGKLVSLKTGIESQLQGLTGLLVQMTKLENQLPQLTEKRPLQEYKDQIDVLLNGFKDMMSGKRVEDIQGFYTPQYEDARYAASTFMVLIGERVELIRRYYPKEMSDNRKWQNREMIREWLMMCARARTELGHGRPEDATYDPKNRYACDEPVTPMLVFSCLQKLSVIERVFIESKSLVGVSQTMYARRPYDPSLDGAGAGAGAAGSPAPAGNMQGR
jgi:ankyrin repeat protein